MTAPTFIQGTHANSTGSTSNLCTFASNVGAGDFIVVLIYGGLGVQYTSVTDSQGNGPGGLYQQAGATSLGSGNFGSIFYAWNTAGGACTVTANATGADNFSDMFIAEYSGVMSSGDPGDGFAGALLANQTLLSSGNLTTSAPGDLLVGLFQSNNGGTGNSDNGFTIRVSAGFGVDGIKDMITGSAGSYAALSNAISGSYQFALGAAFKAPAPPPPAGPTTLAVGPIAPSVF